MSRRDQPEASTFPKWVAVGSLGVGLWLFFGNTLPAVRDRDELRRLETELVALRQRFDATIEQARLGHGARADFDLQSLFVAIDQKGYTLAEFCAAYPSSADAESDAPGAKIR